MILTGRAKGLAEIESHPARAEIVRFGHRAVMQDRAGITDRNDVVFPARLGRAFLTSATIFLAVMRGPESNCRCRLLPGDKHFDVRSADVDDQNLHSIFLQRRPSRASKSSASFGPQEPEA